MAEVGGVAVVLGAVGLWFLGLVFLSDSPDSSPVDVVDGGDGGAGSRLVDDEWSIVPDDEAVEGSYLLSLVRTFALVGEPDEGGLGGRLVWPEVEIDLCDVSVWAIAHGLVQVGIVSPTTEGCPGLLSAFEEYGVPESACLFVRSDGVVDEHCAPLEHNRSQPNWRIEVDDSGGRHMVSMIRRFPSVGEDDVETVGGRLVWSETEVELCNVEVRSAGDGFVQVGDIFASTEDCPGMAEAFEDFGLPESACLFLRSDGVVDEHCAPLDMG